MRAFQQPIFGGIPMHGSPWVPEGQLVRAEGRIYFHQRTSRRRKWRRPHGRPRNASRRMCEKRVLYRPDFDRIEAMTR